MFPNLWPVSSPGNKKGAALWKQLAAVALKLNERLGPHRVFVLVMKNTKLHIS